MALGLGAGLQRDWLSVTLDEPGRIRNVAWTGILAANANVLAGADRRCLGLAIRDAQREARITGHDSVIGRESNARR